ncbi:hypothetical protein GOP47_0028975 [Adiantum capillus-veneris]|nr:hypothetical protein GOP47_0028975 [Adiantum capillus-veneris]
MYEIAVAKMIGRFFDGKSPATMLPFWYKDQHSDIAYVYRQTAKPVFPKVEGVKMVGHVTKQYRLWHWIDDVVVGADTFSVLLFTGCDITFDPDVLLFLEIEINHSRVLLPCLVQVKTHGTMHMVELRDAFDTLDLCQLFLHKKANISRKPKVKHPIDEQGAIWL